jgi:hypothetical protein
VAAAAAAKARDDREDDCDEDECDGGRAEIATAPSEETHTFGGEQ